MRNLFIVEQNLYENSSLFVVSPKLFVITFKKNAKII